MCIDAPESTTNSLSSSLRVDGARKHLFSESETNAVLSFSCNVKIFFEPPRCFEGTLLLPLCLLLRTILKFLERWGYAHEVHLGKYFRAKDFGLEF